VTDHETISKKLLEVVEIAAVVIYGTKNVRGKNPSRTKTPGYTSIIILKDLNMIILSSQQILKCLHYHLKRN
jgi:hypothetical protein